MENGNGDRCLANTPNVNGSDANNSNTNDSDIGDSNSINMNNNDNSNNNNNNNNIIISSSQEGQQQQRPIPSTQDVHTREKLFDFIALLQGRRMDDQRAILKPSGTTS